MPTQTITELECPSLLILRNAPPLNHLGLVPKPRVRSEQLVINGKRMITGDDRRREHWVVGTEVTSFDHTDGPRGTWCCLRHQD